MEGTEDLRYLTALVERLAHLGLDAEHLGEHVVVLVVGAHALQHELLGALLHEGERPYY